MAVVGGRFGVIKHSLIRDVDIKNFLHNVGSFAGRDGEGYVEGQDEAEDVWRVMDPVNIDEGFIRARMNKFRCLE
jgi:hypothetical protein